MSSTRSRAEMGQGSVAAPDSAPYFAPYVLGALFAFLLIAAALVFAPRAQAQQPDAGTARDTGVMPPSGGWYGGLSAGRSQFGIRDSLLPASGVTLSPLQRDQQNAGYKLYGGYQFNRNLTLEGGYADFGRFDAQREQAATLPGPITGNTGASGFYLGAVGIVPLPNRFSVFGKLGTAYTTSAGFVSAGGVALPLSTPPDLGVRRSEWNSKYGLGANYEMSNKLGLRFQYERTNSFGDGRPGEGTVGMWWLGVTQRY